MTLASSVLIVAGSQQLLLAGASAREPFVLLILVCAMYGRSATSRFWQRLIKLSSFASFLWDCERAFPKATDLNRRPWSRSW
jgi:hypothetical protein